MVTIQNLPVPFHKYFIGHCTINKKLHECPEEKNLPLSLHLTRTWDKYPA